MTNAGIEYRVRVDTTADGRFTIRVDLASTGQNLETHEDLSLDADDPRYVADVLRRKSHLVRATYPATCRASRRGASFGRKRSAKH